MSDELFPIADEIYIVPEFPFLLLNDYKNKKKILVLGDIHFGQELTLVNYDNEVRISIATKLLIEHVISIIEKYGIGVCVLNGDIMHNAYDLNKQEKIELKYFINSLKGIKLIFIRGNHDILLEDYLATIKLVLLDRYIIKKTNYKIIICHGHEMVNYNKNDILILSHEHPAYVFKGMNRERIKLHAFVSISSSNLQSIIILPSSNEISTGIKFPPRKMRFLSPILNNINIKSIQLYPFQKDLGVLPIPKINYE